MEENKCYLLGNDRKTCLFFREIGGKNEYCRELAYDPNLFFPEKLFGKIEYNDLKASGHCILYCRDSKEARKVVETIREGMVGLIKKLEEKESAEANVS